MTALVFMVLLVLGPGVAGATQRYGPLQISGNLQSQNLVRHPDVRTYQFIQNRNSARIRLEYKWLERGKFYGKYNIPFITPRGHHTPIFDGWGLASQSTGRSETSLRFTYQF